jgi:hypothetical protein
MSTPSNPVSGILGALGIIQDIGTLEPVAFGLVLALVNGLKGKTDAEILAGDAQDWAGIVATAHAAQQPTPPITQ